MMYATSFLFFLFAECGLLKNDICEGKNGDYLIQNHEAFISAIKNTKAEYDIDYKSKKEAWVVVKLENSKFYIICHKDFDEADGKNSELEYFKDRMGGIV